MTALIDGPARPASLALEERGRCCYCRGTLHAGGASWRCPDCGVLIHPGCAKELRRPDCPTLGCGSAAGWDWAERPRAPRARVTATLCLFIVALLLVVGGGQAALLHQLAVTRVVPAEEPVRPPLLPPDAWSLIGPPMPEPIAEPPPPAIVLPDGTSLVTLTRRAAREAGLNGVVVAGPSETVFSRITIAPSSAATASGNRWSLTSDSPVPRFSTWTARFDASTPETLGREIVTIRVPAGKFPCVIVRTERMRGRAWVDREAWWSRRVPIPVRVTTTTREGARTTLEVTELVAVELPEARGSNR